MTNFMKDQNHEHTLTSPDCAGAGMPGIQAPFGESLACRLGVTRHVSPLRIQCLKLMRAFPSPGAAVLEDWLLDVANVRGAGFVLRHPERDPSFKAPGEDVLSDEELVVAICLVNNLDRPQMLRAAAQLVSRGRLSVEKLCLVARRERVVVVLAELARQALRVESGHSAWTAILAKLGDAKRPRSPIMHWTRLAIPIPDSRGINTVGWRLVS